MKTSSAKAKGRNLQKHVVSVILKYFTQLAPDDCLSRAMGSGGEDIMLSPLARKLLPISVECKAHKAFAVYKDYEQAKVNSKGHEPVLVIKQNHDVPLAIMNLDYFIGVLHENQEAKKPKPNSKEPEGK